MSYARFVEADVYVFSQSGGGLTCCGCWLQERRYVEDPDHLFGGYYQAVEPIVRNTRMTTDEMVAHLREHQQAGHCVPTRVFEDLEADREENDRTA